MIDIPSIRIYVLLLKRDNESNETLSHRVAEYYWSNKKPSLQQRFITFHKVKDYLTYAQ